MSEHMSEDQGLFKPDNQLRDDDLLQSFKHRDRALAAGNDYHPVGRRARQLPIDAEFHQAANPAQTEAQGAEPFVADGSYTQSFDTPRTFVGQPVGEPATPTATGYEFLHVRDESPSESSDESPFLRGDVITLQAVVARDDYQETQSSAQPEIIPFDEAGEGRREQHPAAKWAAVSVAGIAAVVAVGTIAETVMPMPWEKSSDDAANSATKLTGPSVAKKHRKNETANIDTAPSVAPSPSETATADTTTTITPAASPTDQPVPTETPTELAPTVPFPTETTITVPPTSMRVGTFNIYHSDDQSEAEWKNRLRKSANAIKGQPADTEWFEPLNSAKALEVGLLQEVRPDQQAAILKDNFLGKDYDMYPRLDRNQFFTPNPIIWRKDLFDLVKTDSVRFRYFGGAWLESPAVLLESKITGKRSWVLNTHYPADVNGEADMYRHENDQIYLAKVEELRHSEDSKDEPSDELTPVVFGGDYNTKSALTDEAANNPVGNEAKNLSVCALTSTGILKDTYLELVLPGTKPEDCGKQTPEINTVDHIFSTSEFAILGAQANKGPVQIGSDSHSLYVVDLQLQGFQKVVPVESTTTETPAPETPTTSTTPEIISRDPTKPLPGTLNHSGGKK